jgi:hypothetical protein
MNAAHEEMMAEMRAWRKEMNADRKARKATNLEANPEWTIGRSLRHMSQWKLAERRISGIGAI